ncbi:hypothetical protein AMTRI_Chr06g177050 [Amborella trichopoda]
MIIPFSAFCLRLSVVSVLISIISDTWSIGPHDIKLIFQWGRAFTMRCTTARAWRTPTNSIPNFSDVLRFMECIHLSLLHLVFSSTNHKDYRLG